MKYEVLEEWKRNGWRERLVLTKRGRILAQWFSRYSLTWQPWDEYGPLPLFHEKKPKRAK